MPTCRFLIIWGFLFWNGRGRGESEVGFMLGESLLSSRPLGLVVLTFTIKKLGLLIKSLQIFIFRYVYFLRFLSKVLVTHKEVPLVVALLIVEVLWGVLHLHKWHIL
jgi:hypothetical protein